MRLLLSRPPELGLTTNQRQVIRLAREGRTDAEIAQRLGVSEEAIKKRWRPVYLKIEKLYPGVLAQASRFGRGAERRRAVIEFLREQPEELWP